MRRDWGLRKIANSIGLQLIGEIVRPNDVINNGVINDRYLPLPQVAFLSGASVAETIFTTHESSYNNVTGRGEVPVPFSKEFYLGEVL
jgi:hypothetical protein